LVAQTSDSLHDDHVAVLKPFTALEGMRLAIREGGRTVGSGLVTNIVE
jgi:translation elongation factor EF-Tu-like GTPase